MGGTNHRPPQPARPPILPIALLFLTALGLAYWNGANDDFKGVASLYASGTTTYRTALLWGVGATLLGSVASVFLAQALLEAFSGKGLVPPAVAGGELFLLSVAGGAGGTVLLATLLGFPISTTHSLVGGIVGAGALAAGSDLNVAGLTSAFLVPLLASPLMALALAAGLYFVLHRGRRWSGLEKDSCVCVTQAAPEPQASGAVARVAVGGAPLQVVMGREHECREPYVGIVAGVRAQSLVDAGHFLSAGLVSFARGVNDTPKIAALLLTVELLDVRWGLVAVAAAMALGGLLGARKVARTLGERITTLNHGQGLSANVATGILVIWASRLGLPVSTTHVSVGALFGIGLTTGQANLPVVRDVVLSWVVTLPCAAALGAGVYALAG